MRNIHITNNKTTKQIENLSNILNENLKTEAKFNNRKIFRRLSEFLLSYDINKPETETNNIHRCPVCERTFAKKLRLTHHQLQNQDCKIIYLLEKHCLGKCPTHGCNTLWSTQKDLENIYNTTVT